MQGQIARAEADAEEARDSASTWEARWRDTAELLQGAQDAASEAEQRADDASAEAAEEVMRANDAWQLEVDRHEAAT